MQVNPEFERYGDIKPLEEVEKDFNDLKEKLAAEGKQISDVIVKGDSEIALKKLQDDLRKVGYKKVR